MVSHSIVLLDLREARGFLFVHVADWVGSLETILRDVKNFSEFGVGHGCSMIEGRSVKIQGVHRANLFLRVWGFSR